MSSIEKTKLFRMIDKFNTFDRPFKPKISDCKEIFRNVNRNIFASRLALPKFKLVETDEYWGLTEVDENTGEITICINKDFLSKRLFVYTMAHEMVHQWEWVNNRKMTHGNEFFKWREALKKFNIILTRAYRVRHYVIK